MDRISVSLILKGIVSLVMLTLGQYLTHSVLWAAVGWSLASVIVVVFYDLPNGATILKSLSPADDSLYPRFDLHVMLRLMWLALPLGITTLLISLTTNIPRYFIAQYTGERGLGIFAAISYLATAGTAITAALGQSASPRLAKQYAAGERHQFLMLLLKLTLIGLLLGCAGVIAALAAGKPILTLLYQPEYAAQNAVFVWIMVGAGVSYIASFGGYGLTSARFFKIQPIIFAVCTLSVGLLCALLIPLYGLLGAAWAILITTIIQLLLTGIYMGFALLALSCRVVNT
jgi:O-antigen/teichoic acid export membrane protein